ncbi:hypothetical protein [Amycolatopsis samaneae]|uniref:HIT domain-containing protein n=1 Tax=Amycolatopsis samaneae TaxID=664691 RepID=A0ABW5G9R7_9PSEU
MTSPPLCQGADFCQELSGSGDTSFARVYGGDPPDRRIVSFRGFELVADMSPLAVGHLLLLPRKHHLSFARVIAEGDTELRCLLDWVTSRYTDAFSAPLVLEHGSTEEAGQQACITHAHWHLLPVSGDAVDALLERDGLAYYDIDDLGELGTEPWTRVSYYFRLYRGRGRIYLPAGRHQRQYLRSVVGAVLSIADPEWDYAVVIRKEYLRSTVRRTANWTMH